MTSSFDEPERPRDDSDALPAETVPVSIVRGDDGTIVISWSDQTTTRWSAARLRRACPCATCREKKRGDARSDAAGTSSAKSLPVLSAAEARPLMIESMRPVGSYAYNIAFSDGHASGIFPFALLHDPPES